MRFLKVFLIISIASLSLLIMPSFTIAPTRNVPPVMASYNPAPANNFHSPLSTMGLVGLTKATPDIRSLGADPLASSSSSASGPQTIRQNALRFIIDNSSLPQSETTIAVDSGNLSRVVGGFNDAKFLLCGAIRLECGGSFPASLSGFTTSEDGGITIAKSEHIPDLDVNGTSLVSWGDPSLAASVDGNFFYASLAIDPRNTLLGNGVMIAKSNSNLFNRNVSCTTSLFNPTANSCWTSVLVFGNIGFPTFTFEDKDRIAVDHDPSSPFFGSVYIGWDHFVIDGTSSSYLARCDGNLTSCTIVSGLTQPVLSGSDLFVAWTTPLVDKNGNVIVAWCNFGTFITFGPVNCRMRSSPPGGMGFGQTENILSYMGTGTTLPNDTVVVGWATEQFRIAAGLISITADTSPLSGNLYFSVQVCISGHYYVIPRVFTGGAADNPGNCGRSAVLFSRSIDGGVIWSSPVTLSKPAVNDQPFVTVDSVTGRLYVLYYTTQFDPFDHRIDVVVSISSNGGQNFHLLRVTKVSNEPDSDPNMYNYLAPAGLGSSFVVPQYGDYFEAAANSGSLMVLFTANYVVEAGTFQTDPFLAVLNQNGQSTF